MPGVERVRSSTGVDDSDLPMLPVGGSEEGCHTRYVMNLDSVGGEVVELRSLRTAAPHEHVSTYLEEDEATGGSGSGANDDGDNTPPLMGKDGNERDKGSSLVVPKKPPLPSAADVAFVATRDSSVVVVPAHSTYDGINRQGWEMRVRGRSATLSARVSCFIFRHVQCSVNVHRSSPTLT